MKRILIIAMGASALMLSACGSQLAATPPDASPITVGQSAPVSDPLAQLSSYTLADLQAADSDAVFHNDTIAHQCYPALEQFISGLPNAGSLTVSGAFSVFQKGRDVRNAVNAGIPDYLTIGCGPLYTQVHGDLLNWLAKAGVAATIP